MFLTRKITRAKWEAKQGLAADEIPSDAITIDLRTQGNALSFWQCPTDAVSDVEDAVLAIAASSERIDRLDIVWLADEKLQADGQVLTSSRGRTPVTDMTNMHVDVSRLDYVRLGKVAERVDAAISDSQYRRLTRACVKRLLMVAVEQGRIDVDTLRDGVRTEVIP